MENYYSITLIHSRTMTKLVNGLPDYMLTLNGGSLTKRHYCGSYIEALDIVIALRLTLTDEDKGLFKLSEVLKKRIS